MSYKLTGKPGEKAWVRGRYRPANGGYEIEVPEGRTLPPTQKKGIGWVLVLALADPVKKETERA